MFKGENNVTQKRRKRDAKRQVLSQFKAHQSRKGGGSTTKVNIFKLGKKRCTLLQTVHNSNRRRRENEKRTGPKLVMPELDKRHLYSRIWPNKKGKHGPPRHAIGQMHIIGETDACVHDWTLNWTATPLLCIPNYFVPVIECAITGMFLNPSCCTSTVAL